jgi:hypothetical protein
VACKNGETYLRNTGTVHVICVSFIGVKKLQKATISFIMTVCLSIQPSIWNNSAPTLEIFIKFYIWVFFEHNKHNHNISYLMLYHGNNGYVNKPQHHIISTLPGLLRHVSDDDQTSKFETCWAVKKINSYCLFVTGSGMWTIKME